MKAAVVREVGGGFAVEELEIAAPIGREVLVEVRAAGLCHSDLHFAGGDFGMPLPAVLGHELAGVVLEVGPEVRDLSPGQHVVASLVQFCGHCAECLSGRTFRCSHGAELLRDPAAEPRLRDASGAPVLAAMGTAAFAERALVHENQLVAIPPEIPFPQAAVLGCAVATGAGAALNAADLRPGDSVAVIGCGGVGLNAVQGAALAGAARVIAVDLADEKLELARRFGATDLVNGGTVDAVDAVRAMTGGAGVDVSFEVIGLPATTVQAVRMTRVGGRAMLIGLHRPGAATELSMFDDVLAPQRTISGIFMGSSNIKRDIPRYAELYLQDRFNLDDLISGEIGIGEINEAYERLAGAGAARYVVTRWGK